MARAASAAAARSSVLSVSMRVAPRSIATTRSWPSMSSLLWLGQRRSGGEAVLCCRDPAIEQRRQPGSFGCADEAILVRIKLVEVGKDLLPNSAVQLGLVDLAVQV